MEQKKELATTINAKSLAIYSPTSRELRQYNSQELCIKADVPTLGAVKRGIGEVKAEAYLKIWIINLQETLNPKRGMTPEQIDECAYYLIQDFYNLNLADINLVFTEAKKGRFGELYESLNMAKIISWFDVYRESRLETAAQLSQRHAQKHKYNAKRNNDGKWIDAIK